MKQFCRRVLSLLVLIVAVAASSPGWALGGAIPYSLGVGAEFASGSYGTGIRVESLFLPVTAAVYPTERLDFSLEIPLVYQSSSSVVAGEFMASQSHIGSHMAMTMGGSGMNPGMTTSASPGGGSRSQQGLGDIKLKAGYVLYSEERLVPAIRPNFFVKFPTADKGKFLGTGAFDEGMAVELTKWFGNWFADGEVGYTFQGKSSIVAVKDYLYYYAGGGYQLTERWRPMLLLKGSSSTVQGGSPLLEARLRARYQIFDHTGLDGYLSKGIERDSPDFGVGLAISHDF